MPLFFYLPCLSLSSLAGTPFKYSAMYLLNTKSFSTLTNEFIIDADSHLSVIPSKWSGKFLLCSVLCLLEGQAAPCQGIRPFINVIWFNKMKTENQFNNISIWHKLPSFYSCWANLPVLRKTHLKATLATFLFMCFHWPGYFKGCTKWVLQE